MKRRWFQIHLSTAVVLMFVAGGLLGLNLRSGSVRFYFGRMDVQGWPLIVSAQIERETPREPTLERVRNVGLVIVNMICLISILCFVAVMCEWFLSQRRRKCSESKLDQSRPSVVVLGLALWLFFFWLNTRVWWYQPENWKIDNRGFIGVDMGVYSGWPFQISSYGNGCILQPGATSSEMQMASRAMLDIQGDFAIHAVLANLLVALIVIFLSCLLWARIQKRYEARTQ